MNIHLAMANVAALLDQHDADHSVCITAEQAESVRTLLEELLFMRKRAQDLGLLNLVAERKLSSVSNVPPPPETQPNLPEGPEGAEESSS